MKPNYYQYALKDGRTVLSPVDLSYAHNSCLQNISLDRIRPEDMAKVSIIADKALAALMTIAMDGSNWEEPAYAMEHQQEMTVSYHRHYCILQDGQIYINNGGYVPLQEALSRGKKEEKNYIITQIANQAALAQLALSQIDQSPKAVRTADAQ